jgi:Flp pilus assembly pilin Flp
MSKPTGVCFVRESAIRAQKGAALVEFALLLPVVVLVLVAMIDANQHMDHLEQVQLVAQSASRFAASATDPATVAKETSGKDWRREFPRLQRDLQVETNRTCVCVSESAQEIATSCEMSVCARSREYLSIQVSASREPILAVTSKWLGERVRSEALVRLK